MRIVIVAMIGALGCYASYSDYADEREGGGIDVSGDGRADADDGADGDADPDDGVEADAHADDAEAEARIDVWDGDLPPCQGGLYDPTSGLCWQHPRDETTLRLNEAVTYCEGLSLGAFGPGSWHLPTVDELRSLIRRCPATEPGGACRVTDSCAGEACWSDVCFECRWDGGGCFWPRILGSGCADLAFWSSSNVAGTASLAWVVNFDHGNVHYAHEVFDYFFRCVRSGP